MQCDYRPKSGPYHHVPFATSHIPHPISHIPYAQNPSESTIEAMTDCPSYLPVCRQSPIANCQLESGDSVGLARVRMQRRLRRLTHLTVEGLVGPERTGGPRGLMRTGAGSMDEVITCAVCSSCSRKRTKPRLNCLQMPYGYV